MIINVYAGHNPDGKIGSGASGLIKESTEARKVKDYLLTLLINNGHNPIDCTCERAISIDKIVPKIKSNCDINNAEFTIGIHFCSGDERPSINYGGNITYTHLKNIASKLISRFNNIGLAMEEKYAVNEETKTINNLLIINICSVDSEKDVSEYNYRTAAIAICNAITDIIGSNKVQSIFKVKVAVDRTYIRTNAGLNYPVATRFDGKRISKSRGTVLSIIDTRNGFGKLKSGEGWINLYQTMRTT